MTIENNCIVSIHYKLKNKYGEVINASSEGEPLTFLHGSGAIIPGLDKELVGRQAGDEFSVEIPPEDGYGQIDPCLYAVLKIETFSGIDEVKPGMQFQAQDEKGNSQIIRVMAVEGDQVTVNRNHPLAGETLYFDIKVESVQNASHKE
ncbi:MAG: peptidylprolyl isomerase [Candidatus Sabulitectum sp.]|nr:peptidylprolyl isomerase [Candidatus Sabulitectum sp.]